MGINVTPIDDVRLYVKISDNDDGIRLDGTEGGNNLFKIFQQSTNVGRMFLRGNGRSVLDLGDGKDASFIDLKQLGIGNRNPSNMS